MNEQQFIYERLSYLNDRIEFLYDTVEKQQDLLGKLFDLIEKMQSPNYLKQQVERVKKDDILDKIEFMNRLMKK